MLGVVGVAVDYATWTMQRAALQQAADSAALAVASDMQVSGVNALRMQSLAESYVKSNVKLQRGDGAVSVTVTPVMRERPGGTFVPAPQASGPMASAVTITLTQRKFAIMSRLVTPHLTDLSVSATAETIGSGSKLCIVVLSTVDRRAFHLNRSARIEASDCTVYSLSSHAEGLDADDESVVDAKKICTVGGFHAKHGNFKPSPVSGCPTIKDPMAQRPAPPVESGCQGGQTRGTKLRGGTYTLEPGTYCGGLSIEDGAEVRLNPGIYVMKDGPLVVGPPKEMAMEMAMTDAACENSSSSPQCQPKQPITTIGSLKGDAVGIYFTGNFRASKIQSPGPLHLLKHSVVELTAPRTGPMAGVMLFEDRSSPVGQHYDILSDTARRLVGTIYLPRGTFRVRSHQAVADQSEYTAIVANKIFLDKEPRLVVNTRYGATDVPVPTGLGPTRAPVGLAK